MKNIFPEKYLNVLGLSWPGGTSWVSGTVPEWAQNAASEEKDATVRAINKEYQQQAAAGYDLGEAEGGITSYGDMVIIQFRNGDNITSPWDVNRKWGAIIAPFAGMAFSVKGSMARLWGNRLPLGDSLEWTNPDTGKTDTWQIFYGSESFIGDSSADGTGWGFSPGSTLKNSDLIEAMIKAYAQSAYYNEDMKRPYTLGLLMDNAKVDEATGIVYQEFFGNDSTGVAPNRQDTKENKWGVSYMAAGSEEDTEIFIITDKIMTAWGKTWKSHTDRFSVSGAPVADQVTDEEGNVSQIFEKIVITVAKDSTETVISRDNAMQNFSVGVEGSQVYVKGDQLDVVLPAGTDAAAVAPAFDIQENAKAVPASGTALGANSSITYTITAESGETREYTVTVYVAAVTPADEDQAAAGKVMDQIDTLPDAEDIYLNHRETVAAARTAFEALTPIQKSLVANMDRLSGVEQAIRRLENTPVRVTCVGDSITEGVGASVSGKCYVSQVQKLLGREFTVCNAGVSGMTLMSTPEAYTRTGRYITGQKFAPDVVTIMLGTNDGKDRYWGQGGNGKYDAEQFEREMTELINVYRNLPSRPIVMAATSPTAYGRQVDTIDDSYVTEIVAVQKKVAADLGCPVIDINDYTKGHEDWFVDGVHPNDKGHTEMSKEFARAIAEVNKAVLSSLQVGHETIELREGVYDYTINAAGCNGVPAVTAVGANGAQAEVNEGNPTTITVISKNKNYKSVYTVTKG